MQKVHLKRIIQNFKRNFRSICFIFYFSLTRILILKVQTKIKNVYKILLKNCNSIGKVYQLISLCFLIKKPEVKQSLEIPITRSKLAKYRNKNIPAQEDNRHHLLHWNHNQHQEKFVKHEILSQYLLLSSQCAIKNSLI